MSGNERKQAPRGQFVFDGTAMSPDAHILATGLVAADTYTSRERHDFEVEHVFRKAWLCAGVEGQAPAPGDYFLFDLRLADTSLIVIRDKQGKLRAFHNSCMHRGMQLLWEDSGHVSNIRCPYHAWTYATNGRLVGVPEKDCFGDFDMADSGLREVAVGVWEGLVFVNLDPAPRQGLDDYLGGFAERLRGIPLPAYSHCIHLTAEVASNWKAGFDSQCEGYHVPMLHNKTVREMLSSKDNPFVRYSRVEYAGPHRNGTVPGNVDWRPSPKRPVQSFAMAQAAQVTTLADSGIKRDDAGGLASHPGLNLDRDPYWANEHFGIFPNLIFHPTSSGWFTAQFWPLAPDRHLWEHRYYFTTPQSLREEFGIAQAMAFFRDVLMEDFIAVERQQKSLQSGALKFLRFSDQELMPRHQAAILGGIENHVKGHLSVAAE